MRHDLEIPERYGIRQSVGDTVGPGGVMRALRNIPVFVDIARDMEELCPDAWLLNLTNPMTDALPRGHARDVDQDGRAVPRGHDRAVRPQPAARRRLPSTQLEVGGRQPPPVRSPRSTSAATTGLARCASCSTDADARADEPLAIELPDDLGCRDGVRAARVDQGRPARHNRVKLELFDRFGVLPGAGDRHVAEFFPGFLTEESGWGEAVGRASSRPSRTGSVSRTAHVAALEAHARAPTRSPRCRRARWSRR